jgi:hypothetical protein
MRTLVLAIAVLLGWFSAAHAAETVAGFAIGVYDKGKVSQFATECDRATAYVHDRDAVSRGVAREDIDLLAATELCLDALRQFPGHPRLHYQLGRIYGYRGEMENAMKHRTAAAEGGYPIAVFVLGYVKLFGDPSLRDVCGGAQLIAHAAKIGAYAGLVGYPAYTFAGLFKDCGLKPQKSAFTAYLAEARKQAKGQFENLLVDSLTREAGRMPE